MTDDARSVVVTVPSFKRPDRLDRLLGALAAQCESVTRAKVRVMVIDNDPAGTAQDTSRAHGVQYELEPGIGLSRVRNRALDEAAATDADALIFIDDDEVPQEGWLDAIIAPWCEGRADLVSGRVESTFAVPPDPWITAGGFFRRVEFTDGQLMEAAPTNNLLVDLAVVARTGVRFDERFGSTGGEDIHFTRTLRRSGARIVAAPDALVLDPVPAERATRQWVLRRAFRVGTTTARGDIVLASSPVARLGRRVTWIVIGTARMIVGAARATLGAVMRSTLHNARGSRLMARGAGMAAGGIGIRYHEYQPRKQTDAQAT
ncbi:MAG: glycosyltransferase [Microbacterium sp.]